MPFATIGVFAGFGIGHRKCPTEAVPDFGEIVAPDDEYVTLTPTPGTTAVPWAAVQLDIVRLGFVGSRELACMLQFY